MSSSKISSWMENINGNNSEMNSNMYRNRENPEMQLSVYKRDKSSRSNASNKRRKKKHHMSIGLPIEKQKTVDTTKPKNFTNQLISLIQQIHSPTGETSHNHSHSEVYSQSNKRIIQSKSGQHYKAAK